MEEVKAAAEPPPSPLILPLKTARHSDRREESASHKVASALGFTPEAVQNFTEEKLVFFIENMHDHATAYAYNFQCTYNPLDKVVELYERLLQLERGKVMLLENKLESK